MSRRRNGRSKLASAAAPLGVRWTASRRNQAYAWPRAWHRFATFQVVCFAWVVFRDESFSDAWEILTRVVTA